MAEVKSGAKSTEFWVSVIALLGAIGGAFIGKVPPDTLATVLTVVPGAYALARGIVKMTATKKDDEILDAIQRNILNRLPVGVPKNELPKPENK